MAWKNIGSVDKIARLLFAASFIAAVFLLPMISYRSPLGIGLLVAAGILSATAFINFCPLYRLVNIRT